MTHPLTSDVKFSIIPDWVLDSKISDRAVRVYGILARYADNETLQAFPSRQTIAKRAGCGLSSVKRAIDELVEIKAIDKVERYTGGSQSTNLYTLRRVGPQTKRGGSPVERGGSTGGEGGGPRVDHRTRPSEREPKNYSAKAIQMPKDWQPQEGLEERYPTLKIDEEAEAFSDYHLSKGTTFKDWDRAFSTWLRNAVKFSQPKTVIHKQEAKGPAQIPGRRDWVIGLHRAGEHYECKGGEFGHPADWSYDWDV